MVTKKKKAKVKKRPDGAPDDGRAPGSTAAAATEAAPVHDSAMEEPAGLSARERRDAAEAEYQVRLAAGSKTAIGVAISHATLCYENL